MPRRRGADGAARDLMAEARAAEEEAGRLSQYAPGAGTAQAMERARGLIERATRLRAAAAAGADVDEDGWPVA